uniref:Uncharacterized protein n=1 Tax=Desulfovibrio sp. U5L TaxID=596152 RepID=I2PWX3_9BACT
MDADRIRRSLIISSQEEENLNNYLLKKFESYPIDKEALDKVLYLSATYKKSFDFNFDNIGEIISLKTRLELSSNKMEVYDKAAKAYIDIQLGKILIIIHDIINKLKLKVPDPVEREKIILKINEDLFPTKKSRSRRSDLRNVAAIPNVEKFYFLGIELLIEISRVVKDLNSSNPIEDIILESGIDYQNLDDLDEEKRSFMLKLGVNKIKFQKKSINIPSNILESVTKSFGIISEDSVKKVSNALKKGSSIIDVVDNFYFKQPKQLYSIEDIDMAPSWNRMEEVCLQLMDMIEDRIDDGRNQPNYSPERTAKMFKTLLFLIDALNAHWSKNWNNWSEVWESYDGASE